MMIPKLHQSGLLFVPPRWQRAQAIRWLKRVHAWTGFWGALLFLTMGVSGVLLNHRSQMKIETGEPVEVRAMDVAIPPGSIRDEAALGQWAIRQFDLKGKPRPGGKSDEHAKEARFMGKDLPVAEKWEVSFRGPNGQLTVSHIKGSASISVREDAQNIWGMIKNLHKGSGVGIAWVLFIDTIGGALIAMSLTGFLLWSRLHGSRLLGGGLLVGSAVVGAAAIWPHLI